MHELSLESLAYGGDAVGHLGKKVIFVPLGAPGDRVRARILKETASYYRGEILRLIEAGPGRRTPPCLYHGACGGCQWQHIHYEAQADWKDRIFRQVMDEAKVKEILPLAKASFEFGYRRRVRMHFTVKSGKTLLGFFRWRSHHLLDVERCLLLSDTLQQGADLCRAVLGRLQQARGSLVMLAGDQGEVHISIRIDEGREEVLAGLAERDFLAPIVGGQVLFGDQSFNFGERAINLAILEERPLWGSAAAFAQSSSDQERVLRRRVARWAEPEGARVLELFAGVGNLTRDLSEGAHDVLAVESSAVAAKLLLRNAASTRGSIAVRAQDATAALRSLAESGEHFDVVVLDPPREGCHSLLGYFAAVRPQRVVYVSCDPMTLARDLVDLTRLGYQAECAQALDMMPQSFHIEGVVRLTLA